MFGDFGLFWARKGRARNNPIDPNMPYIISKGTMETRNSREPTMLQPVCNSLMELWV